jgi:hypothetical protein
MRTPPRDGPSRGRRSGRSLGQSNARLGEPYGVVVVVLDVVVVVRQVLWTVGFLASNNMAPSFVISLVGPNWTLAGDGARALRQQERLRRRRRAGRRDDQDAARDGGVSDDGVRAAELLGLAEHLPLRGHARILHQELVSENRLVGGMGCPANSRTIDPSANLRSTSIAGLPWTTWKGQNENGPRGQTPGAVRDGLWSGRDQSIRPITRSMNAWLGEP